MENINVISSYINEIPNKLLTHEEELDLARRYKNDNDQEAFKELIIHNLSLVVNLAKKYTKLTSLPLEDVIQSGNLGLIKAAEKFNPELGFRFTTYAYRWILQSIQYNIKKDQRTIKVPIYLQDLEIKINKNIDENTQYCNGIISVMYVKKLFYFLSFLYQILIKLPTQCSKCCNRLSVFVA